MMVDFLSSASCNFASSDSPSIRGMLMSETTMSTCGCCSIDASSASNASTRACSARKYRAMRIEAGTVEETAGSDIVIVASSAGTDRSLDRYHNAIADCNNDTDSLRYIHGDTKAVDTNTSVGHPVASKGLRTCPTFVPVLAVTWVAGLIHGNRVCQFG